jgi:hypothetical protein
MPAADISKVLFHFLGFLERHELLGYVLALLCATGWFLHARLVRRWIGDERRRLSSERAQLKAMLSGVRNGSGEVQT